MASLSAYTLSRVLTWGKLVSQKYKWTKKDQVTMIDIINETKRLSKERYQINKLKNN